MRLAWLAVLAVLLAAPLASLSVRAENESPDESSEEGPDAWLECWTRAYDAAHLGKHPKQTLTVLTLSIESREPSGDSDPGPYLATVYCTFRGKLDIYAMPRGARCVVAGAAKD